MGKRNRERMQRIVAGHEKSIRAKVDKLAPAVAKYLARGSTTSQVDRLREMLHSGVLSASKLKKELSENAVKEMDKGIRKFIKKGKQPTIELLLEEYDKEVAFQELCNEVGLDRVWFESLAQRRLDERIQITS